MSKLSIQHCTDFTIYCQYDKNEFVMPKKTKKQKILAELHRNIKAHPTISQTQTHSNIPNIVNTQNKMTTAFTPSFNLNSASYKKEAITKAQNSNMTVSYAYVKHDLIKITIFTLFALFIQSVLYFLLRTR